jgi:hypothetical protein
VKKRPQEVSREESIEIVRRGLAEGKTREEIQRTARISRRSYYRFVAEIRKPRRKPQVPVIAIEFETPPSAPVVMVPVQHPSPEEVAAHPLFRTVAGPKLIPIEQCKPDASELRRLKQQELHDKNVADRDVTDPQYSAAFVATRERIERRRDGGLEDLG